jgi:NAD(P)-dependent dehydrogenase (short-subunit alcohol dehydrogenase family)
MRARFGYPGGVIVITGGSRGLGLILARQLKKKGARLVVLARNGQELASAQTALGGVHDTVLALVCDVTDRAQVHDAIGTTLQQLGGIDVLINNAGMIQVGPLEHMTIGDYQQAMNVHFWGALHCTEAVLPHMRQRRIGRIINVASIGGLFAVPHFAPYPNTFARLVALSNRVLPGRTDSRGSEAWPGRESRPRKLPKLVTVLGDRAALENNERLARP